MDQKNKYKIPDISLPELIWKDIDHKYGSWSFVGKSEVIKIKKQLLKLLRRL
jgi:hypothetical protein